MLRYVAVMLAAGAAFAQVPAPPVVRPTVGQIVRLDPGLDDIIPPGAKIEVLAGGFAWAEGPVWIKQGGYVLFSDIPHNAVMKWKDGEGVSVYMKPSGFTGVGPYSDEPGSNGLVIDAQGRLVSCEHGDRRIARLETRGGKKTLVDSYQGKRLNSPNDLVYRSNGDLYFTDPPYGLPQRGLDDPTAELDFCGVYRLAKDGTVTLLTRELSRPNGIAFSPDERTLYVANSDAAKAIWMAFPVKDDGTLGTGRLFADVTAAARTMPGLPDGMKVDSLGRVFATGPGGITIFTAAGRALGRIETGQPTANCNWGDDGSTLYITAQSYLLRVRTNTKGKGW
jgi:gluconolactonase